MDAPFVQGVPYFSREEELTARKSNFARQNMAGIADIDIKNDDTESLNFIQRVHLEIDAWKDCTDVSLQPQ